MSTGEGADAASVRATARSRAASSSTTGTPTRVASLGLIRLTAAENFSDNGRSATINAPTMLRLASKLRPLAAVFVLILLAPGGQQAFAAQGPSLASLRIAGAAEIQDVFIRAPQNVSSSDPLQVLIALHGMGGNGGDFGGAFASQ